MVYVLTFIHVIVSVVLILVVLLQTGKRADLAGAFGGGGSQTVFGARGAASALSRATTICAIVFMLTSLALSIMSTRSVRGGATVLEKSGTPAAPTAPAPAAPAAPTPAK
jgi:preprotein translocase subunit SecG